MASDKAEILSNPDACLKKASAILSVKFHSVSDLRRKLRAKGFYSSAVDPTIEKLKSLDFLNDSRFAESYARELRDKGFGARRISEALARRLVPQDIVRQELAKFADDGGSSEEVWLEEIAKLLKKKERSFEREKDDRKRKRKIYAYLLSRGYRSDQIAKALSARDQNLTE